MTIRLPDTQPPSIRIGRGALAACVLLVALAGCKRDGAGAKAPGHLPQVPAGLGTAFEPGPVVTVKDRKLVLPGGLDEAPVLELPATTKMAELSVPFSELQQKLGDLPVCLEVSAAGERRCVTMRPMSGEQFGEWLDAKKPAGKIRLVMRTDGIEVVADRGKVPGPDRYGPSIPPVDGRPDFATLEEVLGKLSAMFPTEKQAVLAPSAGLELAEVAQALALLHGPDGERFPEVFLVYP